MRKVRLFVVVIPLAIFVYQMVSMHLRGVWIAQNETRGAPTKGSIVGSSISISENNPKEGLPKQPACVFPKLELNDPEIMKFYQKFPKLECASDPDWVVIKRGMLVISAEAAKKHPDIHCDAYPIVKVTDFKTKELDPIKDFQNSTVINNDFYRVNCKSSDGSTYTNYLAGIRNDSEIHKRPQVVSPDGLNLDVVILGLDSTSHLAWQRHLPKSRDYFVNVLNGTEMEGYNILGDGTPAAIMPILLGHREEELHEARRGYKGATSVDDFPWIFKDFKAAGYATNWAEDDAYLGTFQYRLLGFDNQPTDHFFRYFCVAAEPHYKEFKTHCQGSRPRHSVVLDFMYQTFQMYPSQRKWMFSFQSQLSHQDNNQLSYMDDDLLQYLQTVHREKHLDNALFIMLADHGGRFSKVRATEQGKQEERLPYFGIRFPEWFHEKYPQIIKNIKTNSQRLTTPFDVHETLMEVLHYTGKPTADISKRGVSMLQEIPVERDCDKAHVDPHWCSCLDWKKEEIKSPTSDEIVAKVIDTFNNFTAPYRNLCSTLQLDHVITVSSLKVKDAVLKFKDTNDGGRGRFGDMSDTTQTSRVLYQVTLVTQPGGGRFEVTVTKDVKKSQLTIEAKDISRTNVYGKSPHCVEHTEPFLRPYCYCKDLLDTSLGGKDPTAGH
ncbi:hypothetical protein BsWGS_08725 [Bradybaena similaris]